LIDNDINVTIIPYDEYTVLRMTKQNKKKRRRRRKNRRKLS